MVTTGARMAYHRGVPWTDEPPSKPGVHRCRLKAGAGTDQTPFEAELHDDTVNPGGLCCRDRWGMWHRLEALYGRESVEWWRE